jgi:hypothetical protein
MTLSPLHLQVLRAIIDQSGERCPCELAEDLGLSRRDVDRAVYWLSERGYLEPRAYRLTDVYRLGQKGYHLYVGHVEDGNEMRPSTDADLEVRIVRALYCHGKHSALPRENLASALGCSSNDGGFARALRFLVRHGLLYGADSPWPSDEGRKVAQEQS